MKRRDYFKSMMLLSTGLVSLPAWAIGWQIENIPVTTLFNPVEKDLLAAVADTIIPKGNSIGALSVGTEKFLEKLIADCYDPATQENVSKQLNSLEELSQAAYGKSFVEADQSQRQGLLLKFAGGSKEQKDFFDLMKAETIRGFSTSKEVLGDHLKYKVVPGHYKGCVDVNS